MSAEPFDSICLDIMYMSGTNCVDSVRLCVSQRKWCVPNDTAALESIMLVRELAGHL